jgi:hypothetical protein
MAMADKMEKIRRKLEQAVRLIGAGHEKFDAAEERIDSALLELGTLQNGQSGHQGNRTRLPAPARHPAPKPVDSLIVELRQDGTSRNLMDGEEPFELPPRLTELLLFASTGPVGLDGIKGLRGVSEATKALGISRSFLSSLMYRLRRKLRDRGLDPRLLETIRRRDGARIRFRVREVVVIRADNK